MRSLLLALLLLASPAVAQNAPSPTQAAPAEAHALTADDLRVWFDGMMPWLLARGDLAGAVVSVVKDGQVLFARGYGYADVEKRTPVDPATTLFRIGSISKLFTWTSVMQQVEQGKLDLDKDINSYLDFKIPDAFGKPITLRNIMTHTAGFEEASKDLFPPNTSMLMPLGDYMKTHIPARAYPPGEVISYSNYGAGLAAYIVERISGKQFDDYVEQEIYARAGMTQATFRQPLPEKLQPFMSKGYRVASGKPFPFEVVGAAPVGAMSASGTDMAKFMIAHLNAFRGVADKPLLKQETVARMYTVNKPLAPGFIGMALGFYQEDRNGKRIVGHGGNMPVFHSDLHLLPDDNVGLFVSFNTTGVGDVTGPFRLALLREFLDRYYPAPLPDEPTLPTAAEHARVVAGYYSNSRAGVAGWTRLMQIMRPSQLSVNPDNTISFSAVTAFGGSAKKWREVAPFVWREVNGRSRVAVLRDEAGAPTILADDDGLPVYVYLHSSFATGPNALPLIQAAIAVLLVAALSWPVNALVRRHYGGTLRLEGRDLLLYRAARVACIVSLLFAAGWWAVLNHAFGINFMLSDSAWFFWIVRLIGVIGLAGTALLLWRAATTWRDARFGWWGRISNSVIALAALVIIWASFAYNLLSTGLQY
ncbi:MAG: serine hydrolase [Rhodospirillales bacterium]|nr:serine hydrolase [Rhodospirillales bacterium]